MKHISKIIKRGFAILAFSLLTLQVADAQIIFNDDVNDGTAMPIDGFISIAIAGGAYLGYRKINNKKE